jgi:hypothetical protein
MTISDLAAITGLGWDTVKDIIKARLEKDYGHPRLKELKRLSIDEIYVGRRRHPAEVLAGLAFEQGADRGG